MSPAFARALELFKDAEGLSPFTKQAYDYFGRAGWNRPGESFVGSLGGDAEGGYGAEGYPGYPGGGGGQAASGEPGGDTGEGEEPWWSKGIGYAAEGLMPAMAASTIPGMVRGARAAGTAGVGLNMMGLNSPEALKAAEKAKRMAQGGAGITQAAQDAQQFKQQSAAITASQQPKGAIRKGVDYALDAAKKIPGAGATSKVLSKTLPGLNVAGSAWGMYDDASNLVSGKEHEAPESGWGVAGQMLSEGLTPIFDAGAGATAAALAKKNPLHGALIAASARAAINVGRAGAETIYAGKAMWDAARNGGYGNKGKVEDSEVAAFKARKAARQPQAPAAQPQAPAAQPTPKAPPAPAADAQGSTAGGKP